MLFIKLFFNSDKSVVFCSALASAGRTSFYLTCVYGDCKIGNKGILRLAASVGYYRSVTVLLCQRDSRKRLGDCSYLIQLYKDRICAAVFNSLSETCGIGNKKIVAYKLYLASELFSKFFPAIPVLFVKRIFNRNYWIFFAKPFPFLDKLICGSGQLFLRQEIPFAVSFPFA